MKTPLLLLLTLVPFTVFAQPYIGMGVSGHLTDAAFVIPRADAFAPAYINRKSYLGPSGDFEAGYRFKTGIPGVTVDVGGRVYVESTDIKTSVSSENPFVNGREIDTTAVTVGGMIVADVGYETGKWRPYVGGGEEESATHRRRYSMTIPKSRHGVLCGQYSEESSI